MVFDAEGSPFVQGKTVEKGCVTPIRNREPGVFMISSPSFLQVSDAVTSMVCREAVERVASSVTFGRADRLRILVRWLGERSVNSTRIVPTEKEIAREVLERSDFDPQTDSLVRKEMSRLREKLARYYSCEGAKDKVAIVFDSGYLFHFVSRAGRGIQGTEPCWLVLPFRARGESIAQVGEEFLEELLIGLQEKSTLEFVAPTTAFGYVNRAGDLRKFALECKADVVIEGSICKRGDSIEVKIWMVDADSGRARRSTRVYGETTQALVELAVLWLLETEAKGVAARG